LRAKNLDRVWIRGVIVCFERSVKIKVFVTPKRNVLDPQGVDVGHALGSLGLKGLKGTRVGKVIELEVEGSDTPPFRAQLDRLCSDLLSNPVIEDYHYEITGT
jgi:phosphoribosylformylglycinamidine synthase